MKKKQQQFLDLLQHLDLYEALDKVKWEYEDLLSQLKLSSVFQKAYIKSFGLSDKQKDFLEVFPKTFFNITRTCKLISIDRKTYYRWKNESQAFSDELVSVREGIFDDIESILYHKIFIDGDTTALIFFMKTQMKDRGYSEKFDLKLSLKSSTKSDYDEVKNLSDYELVERIRLLKKIAG